MLTNTSAVFFIHRQPVVDDCKDPPMPVHPSPLPLIKSFFFLVGQNVQNRVIYASRLVMVYKINKT
jgi:hypothetical protein